MLLDLAHTLHVNVGINSLHSPIDFVQQLASGCSSKWSRKICHLVGLICITFFYSIFLLKYRIKKKIIWHRNGVKYLCVHVDIVGGNVSNVPLLPLVMWAVDCAFIDRQLA